MDQRRDATVGGASNTSNMSSSAHCRDCERDYARKSWHCPHCAFSAGHAERCPAYGHKQVRPAAGQRWRNLRTGQVVTISSVDPVWDSIRRVCHTGKRRVWTEYKPFLKKYEPVADGSGSQHEELAR
jgi:hypothetical protein